MIITVSAVRMVQVAANEVVDMVVVRHGFMLAPTVDVGRVMSAARV